MKLDIELVPQTAWGKNLRTQLPRKEWDEIRKKVYAKAGNKCEICGGQGLRWSVECHEIWEYDDEKHVQKLVRLIALCPMCHMVKHIGRSKLVGSYEDALTHFMDVNELEEEEAEGIVETALLVWRERSQHPWSLDITKLEEYRGD